MPQPTSVASKSPREAGGWTAEPPSSAFQANTPRRQFWVNPLTGPVILSLAARISAVKVCLALVGNALLPFFSSWLCQ